MRRIIRKSTRFLRSKFKGWSALSDLEFHESHFSVKDFNPFRFSYPGYITIRRFADLVLPYLAGTKTILDIGCGPAEITCELASRKKDIIFIGVDHSSKGIEQAKKNAQRLKLQNIRFYVSDAMTYKPDKSVDLVLMFDAFHHLMDPAKFIRMTGAYTKGFLLIEPRGDWKGTWKKDIDMDWLVLDLDKIRAHLDYLTGTENAPSSQQPFFPHEEKGNPVENRFSLQDFVGFFKNYGLNIRGTVSGLEVYPPGFWKKGLSRERFGKLAYQLYKDVDDRLYKKNLDFYAKHWLIYAMKGRKGENRIPPKNFPEKFPFEAVQGPYGIRYLKYDGPLKAEAGCEFQIPVSFQNLSFRPWSSQIEANPDFVSYHWRSPSGKDIIYDGKRTSFSGTISPGEECRMRIKIKAPLQTGRYILAVDLVREDETWFSEAGSSCLLIPFQITKARTPKYNKKRALVPEK